MDTTKPRPRRARLLKPRLPKTFAFPEEPAAGGLTDDEVLETWVGFLRRRTEDLYYSHTAREAAVTLLLALLVGLLVAWGLGR